MATLTVTTNSDTGADSTLDTDFATDMTDGGGLSIREAIGRASSGDTITFDLDSGTAGAQGGTITLGGSALAISTNLIIDGDLDDDGTPDVTFDADGNSRTVVISGSDVTLHGLTVTGGSGSGGGTVNQGGGIHSSTSGTLTITNSIITGNTTTNGGGGIYKFGGSLVITDSLISGNSAMYGGGIRSVGATNTFTRATITGNSADFVGGAELRSSVAGSSFTNTTISGNVNTSASPYGDELRVRSGEVTISDSIIGSTNATSSPNIGSSLSGGITFSGTVLLTEAFTPVSGSGTVDTPANIFASTEAVTVGGVSTTRGVLADNGGVVQSMAVASGVSAGASPTLAITNTAPRLDTNNDTPLDYTENGWYAQLVGGTLIDDDGDADWDGGTLVVQITGNAETADEVSLARTEVISIVGTDVFSNSTNIGTVSVAAVSNHSTVTGDTALTITFNSNATNTNVEWVLRSIQYQNSSDDPSTDDRTVTITATDAHGASTVGTRTIEVTAVEDGPTITIMGEDPTFTEDGGAVAIFSGADISTVEAGQTITGFGLYVTNVSDGADEILAVDGTDITLTVGTSGTTANNSLTYSVSTSGSGVRVDFSDGTLSEAQINTVMDGVTYRNDSDTPTTTDTRVINFSDIADTGETTSSGGETEVTVVAANDAPTATNSSPLIDEEDGAYALTVADFNFSDVDGDSFSSVRIDSLATVDGSFQLSGVDVEAGDIIQASDIVAGNLTFTPENVVDPDNGSGVLLEFTHSVNDGTTFAASPARMQIEVSFFNDAPTATGMPSDLEVDIETKSDIDLSDIAFADADSTSITVTLSVDTGDLYYTPSDLKIRIATDSDAQNKGGEQEAGSYITLTGSISDIHTYLSDPSSIQYISADGVTGNDAATLTISGGSGRESVSLGTINLDIGTINTNHTPTGLTLSNSAIKENVAGGTVGTVSATDPDGDSITYSVSDSRFEIVGTTLKLKDAASLDYETESSIRVSIKATDSHGASFTKGFTISVTDVGEHTTSDDADTVTGGDEDDLVSSGGGDDRITTGNGRDTIDGGDGDDDVSGGNDDDSIDGGAGSDTVDGGSGRDTLKGGDGDDTVMAGGDDDLVFAGLGDTGNDKVNGDSGDDTIGGGAGNDDLNGDDGDDLVWGGSGNDRVSGGTGDDLIYNGDGSDDITGGAGNDTLWAGAGDDVLTGGTGADTFVFGAVAGNDTITDFDVSEDSLSFMAITGFASAAEVIAAASEVDSSVLIDLGDGESILLSGLTLAELNTASMTFG
ncbi:beta strand repeat-containing protein [Kordiimonas pumila]|uniref:Beta strand repeat-containing protein n=1 Tax=Kordiimonas pumila TaxID=2161677 RepID=A0ABV7D5V9_9PROT|nr:cadherin domain-containing protein [Kordiimonas pumila]